MVGVQNISGAESANRLATHLNSDDRDRPVVVVSIPAASHTPFIDPEEISEQVGDLAGVYLIRTGADTWAFSERMPDQTQVYGGAGRVYPVDNGWTTNPYRSPLRFAFDASQGQRATEALISDALRMASDAGLTSRTAQPTRPHRTGVVIGLPTDGRALVRLDGDLAVIVQELTIEDVPLASLLTVDMEIGGEYDRTSRRLDIRGALRTPDEALSSYRVGDVVLAQVKAVAAGHADLMLHPGLLVKVRREDVTSNDLDQLTMLMTPGEVLTGRLTATAPTWQLSLLDLDEDEEPREAPALLPNGPPWLTLAGGEPGDVAEDEEELPLPRESEQPTQGTSSSSDHDRPSGTSAPTPLLLDPARRDGRHDRVDDSQATLAEALSAATSRQQAAEMERDRLADAVTALHNERTLAARRVDSLTRKLEKAERQLRTLRSERRKDARSRADRIPPGSEQFFTDPDEQFRFDVQLAWARRIPAAEKASRPLNRYEIGPDFLATIGTVDGVSYHKVVAVVVEILTGIATDMPGRAVHPLRVDRTGGSPQVVRARDGAACWRVALQSDTPQARRLHYWRLHDGVVELSRVTLHDDFAP